MKTEIFRYKLEQISQRADNDAFHEMRITEAQKADHQQGAVGWAMQLINGLGRANNDHQHPGAVY
jgi:hypothetical protein